MRYLLFLIFALFAIPSFSQDTDVVRLSEPVYETDKFELFGNAIDVKEFDESVPLAEAIDKTDQKSEMIITAKVNKVCKKNGCFFIAVDDDNSARVTFKDYGFFIPTNSTGKQVVFKGILTEKKINKEQAIHYAKDLDEDTSNIEATKKEYSIVATSIMIPKN